MSNNCLMYLLCVKDTKVSQKECVLFFFLTVQFNMQSFCHFSKICSKPCYTLENVSSNLPVLIWMWFIHVGYGKDRLNWKSEEFLGSCERVWLTALCHKTDCHWIVYWQVARTDIIIQRAVGFICHLFNVSSLCSYLFSAWGIIMKHFLSLFLE